MKPPFRQSVLIVASIFISSLFWFYANELSGNYGYLMWLAPIAVLLCSFKVSAKTAFLLSFISYLIGRLSWFTYLVSVITLVPTIIFTVLFSLIFALIIIATRNIVLKTKAWYSIFAFPVFFTSFEYLLFTFSADGSAGSIAYSQSNYLPVIQVASITGILGITFLLTLIPSTIAVCWHFKKERLPVQLGVATTGSILALVILFGIIRLNRNAAAESLTVGLAVLDEGMHHITDHPDFKKERLALEYYTKQITDLAVQGAKIVVLPERAININKETEQDIISGFCSVARQNKIFLVLGYTNFRTDTARNSALVINTNGDIVVNYNKVHLVKFLEDQFRVGDQTGLFKFKEIDAGTAICKDLDFPGYINKYGKVTMMIIPAWDFKVDGWLHSRMAVLRGVENGFTEIRTARLGRLSISDAYGRITGEADCADGKEIALLGTISLNKSNTFYSHSGNWFGLVNLVGLGSLLILLAFRNPTVQSKLL